MSKKPEGADRGEARSGDRQEARREEILDASLRIFAAKGYHETGIADIAAELGLGHGTFYRYFKNKHDIALCVFDRLLVQLGEIGLSEDPTASATLEEYRAQTGRLLTRWLAFADENPALLRFFHEQSIVIDAERMNGVIEAYVVQTMLFLKNGVDRGFLAETLHVRATAEILVALILEGTRRVAGLRDAASRRRWAEAALALMFHGVSPPTSGRPEGAVARTVRKPRATDEPASRSAKKKSPQPSGKRFSS